MAGSSFATLDGETEEEKNKEWNGSHLCRKAAGASTIYGDLEPYGSRYGVAAVAKHQIENLADIAESCKKGVKQPFLFTES